MDNPQSFQRPKNNFEMLKNAILLIFISSATVTGGTPTAIQYPPETVRGVWGQDILLQFAINGTQPDDSIVLQGPNPQIGSNRLDHIFERGTGESVPHQPNEEDFTVSIVWYEAVTYLNLTIHNLRDKVEGTYRLSMTVLFTGADINVHGWSGDNMTSSTTSPYTTLEGTTSTNDTKGSDPGPTQPSGGLGAGYIVLVVFAAVAPIAILGFCIYKRMTPGAGRRQQASHARQQGQYDTVPSRDGDPRDNGFMPGKEGLELKNMSNRDKEIGDADSTQSNGTIPV